jgi:steroid 5-alpha reductase family enzyme
MNSVLLKILFSILAFLVPFGISLILGNQLVTNIVLLIFFTHWLFFIPAYIFQTEKFFDMTGSFTYLIASFYALLNAPSYNIFSIVVVSCIVCWAIRLGTFLFMRINKDGEDKRFREIKPSFSRFLMTWTLSGTWVSICLLCVLTAICSSSGVVGGKLFYLGFIFFLFGFIIEIVADYQKTLFRSKPINKNKFITTGLWSFSRHPNYMGEIVLWFGISIMSISSLSGIEYITLISPVFVYLLLTKISGVNFLEESANKKWGHLDEYKDYMRKTPKIFFKFPI